MMPENPSHHRQQATEEAAFWLLTLQNEELTATQRAEFGDWLRRSPENIAEVLRVCQLQRDLAALPGWRDMPPSATPVASNVLALPRAATPRAPRRRPVARLAFAAVAAAALLVVATVWLVAPGGQAFSTQAGEQRAVTLSDGSVVSLAPNSRLVVKYQSDQRLIELDRGEALFRVAKNPHRPFIVQATAARVRAVGTVFRVQRDEQGIVVTVVEGRIAVSPRPADRSQATHGAATVPEFDLVANQQVAVSSGGIALPVQSVANSAAVTWAADPLRFENQTVAEVAREFNLHNQVQIEVLDPRLAGRRISGVLRISDPEAFVAFIQAATDTRVSLRDPNHFVLQPAEAGSGH